MTNSSTEARGAPPAPGDTFHIRAEPGDGWWGITIDELATVFAQTRRHEDIEAEARSAIAFWFDVDESQVGEVVVLTPQAPSQPLHAQRITRRPAQQGNVGSAESTRTWFG